MRNKNNNPNIRYESILNSSYNYRVGGNFVPTLLHQELPGLNNVLDRADAPDEAYIMSSVTNSAMSMNKVEAMADNLRLTDNAINGRSSGSLFTFDTETYGDIGEKATVREKKLFAITEMALVEHKYNRITGKVEDEVVQNLLFGIDKSKFRDYQDLIIDYQDGSKILTSAERSTVERLARASATTIKYDTSGRPVVDKVGKYSVNEDSAMRGLLMQINLGERGYRFENITKEDHAYKAIDKFRKNLEVASNGLNVLNAKNGKAFDVPKITEFFKRAGVKFNPGKNMFDMDDTAKAFGFSYSSLYNESHGVKRGYGQLENLVKLLKMKTESHTAADDSKAGGRILFEKLDTLGGDKSILDVLKERADEAVAKSVSVSAGSTDNIIFANKSLSNKPSEKGTFSLDHKYKLGADGTTKIPVTTEWVINKNNFYEMKGFKFIKKNKLAGFADEIRDKIKGTGLYAMELTNAASGTNDHVTIFRETLEEMDEVFKNLGIISRGESGLTQKMIDSQQREYVKDLARRRFEGFFDLSGSGFNGAKKYYDTYDKASKEFNKIEEGLGRKLTKAEKMKYIDVGDFKLGDISFDSEKVFERLSYKGEAIPEQVRDFKNMYGKLEDTHKTMSKVLNTINSNTSGIDVDVTHANKTLALKAVMGELDKQIYSVALQSVNNKTVTYSDLLNFAMKDSNGKVVHLNGGTPGALKGSIYGIINSNTEKAHNAINNNEAANKSFQKILSNFRGFIGEDKYKELSGTRQTFYAVEALSETLIAKRDELLRNVKPAQLLNQNTRAIQINKEIRRLGSIKAKGESINGMIAKGIEVKVGTAISDGIAAEAEIGKLNEELKQIHLIRDTFGKDLGASSPITITNVDESQFTLKDKPKPKTPVKVKLSLEQIKEQTQAKERKININKEIGKFEKDLTPIEKVASQNKKGHTQVSNTPEQIAKANIATTKINTLKKELEAINEILKPTKASGKNQANKDKDVARSVFSMDEIVDKLTDSKNLDLETMAINHASVDINIANGFIKQVGDEWQMDARYSNIFKHELGYGEDEMRVLNSKLHGSSGITSLVDESGKHVFGYSILKEINEAADTFSYKLLVGPKESLGRMTNSFKVGEAPKGVTIVSLPRMFEENGVKFFNYNGSDRHNVDLYEFYQDNREVNNAIKGTLESYSVANSRITRQSSVAKALSSINFHIKDLVDASQNNYAEQMGGRIDKTMGSHLNGAPTPTGYKYIHINNQIEEVLMPTSGLYVAASEYEYAPMVNFLPALYNSDDEFKKTINTLLEMDGINNPTTHMADWQKALGGKGSNTKYGNLKVLRGETGDKNIVSQSVANYFVNNFYQGDHLLDKIIKSGYIEQVEAVKPKKALEIKEMLKELTYGNQILKGEKVVEGHAAYKNHVYQSTMGNINSPNRPVLEAVNKYIPIALEEISDEQIKSLKKQGYSIGEGIKDIQFVKNVYGNSNAKDKKLVERNVSTKYKEMTEEQVIDALNQILDPKGEKFKQIRKAADEAGKVISDEEIMEYVMHMMSNASTYEQGSMIAPALYNLLSDDVYSKINTSQLHSLSENLQGDVKGRTINPGDVLGLDENGKEVLYEEKRAGEMVGSKKGKIFIRQFDPAINEIKTVFNESEKTIGNGYSVKHDMEVMQNIWESAFGHGVGVVAKFEIKKHQSGSTVFGNARFIADTILDSKDPDKMNEFVKIFNDNFPSVNSAQVKTIFEDSERFKRNIFQIDQAGMKDDLDLLGAYNNLLKEYEGKKGGLYDTINENIKDMKIKNEYYGTVTRIPVNEEYKSRIDEHASELEKARTGGKGATDSPRAQQVAGSTIGDTKESRELYRVQTADGFKKSMQPLLDYNNKQILSSPEAIEAQKDLQNLRLMINVSQDDELRAQLIKNGEIKQVKLEDLLLPKGGINKPEDLVGTLFDETNTSMIEVELPLEFKDLLNVEKDSRGAYKSGHTNKLLIPKQTNIVIDKKFYPSKVQQSYTDLLNSLQLFQQNRVGSNGAIDATEKLNKNVKSLLQNMMYEFTDKDGMLFSKVLSGHIRNGGYELIGRALSPVFEENKGGIENVLNSSFVGKHINPAYNTNTIRNINGKDARLDIDYSSERSFLEKGGKELFDDIGYQLVNKNNFDDDDYFVKYLQDEKLIDENKKLIGDTDTTRIGKEYAKVVGLPAMLSRDPEFRPDSRLAILARLKKYDDNTNSVITSAFTLLKMNGDIDGDTSQKQLLLERGIDGRQEFPNKNSEVRTAFDRTINAQALDTESKWNPLAKEFYKKRLEETSYGKDIEGYIKDVTANGMPGGQSYLKNAIAGELAIKNRTDKIGTGNVSNTNLSIKTMAETFLTKTEKDLSLYGDIQNFTTYTEEKPISSKFGKASKEKDPTKKIANTGDYRKGVDLIANGKGEEGTTKLVNSLKTMGAFESSFITDQIDDKTIGYTDVMNGNHGQLIDEIKRLKDTSPEDIKGVENLEHDLMLFKGISATNELFNKDGAVETYGNVFAKKKSFTDNEIGLALGDIGKGNFGKDLTERTKLMQRALTEDLSVPKTRVTKVELDDTSNLVFISKNGGGVSHVDSAVKSTTEKHTLDLTLINADGQLSISSINSQHNKKPLTVEHITDELSSTHLAMDTSGLNPEQLEDVQNYSAYIDQTSQIVEELKDTKIINEKQGEGILESFNEDLINRGKEAKTLNAESALEEQKLIVDRAYENLNSKSSDPKDFVNHESQDVIDSAYDRIVKEDRVEAKNIDTSMYSKYDNRKTYNVDAFQKELSSKFNEITRDLGQSPGKEEARTAFITQNYNIASAEKDKMIENMQSDFIGEYENNQDAFSEYMGWNSNSNDLLEELNINDTDMHETVANHLEEIGGQRVGGGSYAGAKLSELSQSQVNEVLDDLHKLSNAGDKEYYDHNIGAIRQYQDYISGVTRINSNLEQPNGSVSDLIYDASVNSSYDSNLSGNMEEMLTRSSKIESTINAMNESIEEQGRKAGAKSAELTDNVLEKVGKEAMDNKRMNSKTLLITAGVVAALSGIGYIGSAGKMGVNNKPNGTSPDSNGNYMDIKRNTQFVPQTINMDRNITMQGNDGVNYRVSGKANANINDSEVASTINRVMAGQGAKVHFKSSHGYNNNDNWFDEEMSKQLQ